MTIHHQERSLTICQIPEQYFNPMTPNCLWKTPVPRKSILDPSITYPLHQNIPGFSLSFNTNLNCIPQPRIPICESCKRPSTHLHYRYSRYGPRITCMKSPEQTLMNFKPILMQKQNTS